MNLIRKIIAAFALLLCGLPAFAMTQCTSTVSSIGSEAGTGAANIYVFLASGAWFYLPASDPMFKSVSAGAYLALTTQTSVIAQFAASGLTCSSATGRTDLNGFYNNAS